MPPEAWAIPIPSASPYNFCDHQVRLFPFTPITGTPAGFNDRHNPVTTPVRILGAGRWRPLLIQVELTTTFLFFFMFIAPVFLKEAGTGPIQDQVSFFITS